MILSKLLEGIEIILTKEDLNKEDLNKEIQGIAFDSRKVKDNYLFICISGFKTDGHKYVEEAIKNGAIAILAEKEIDIPENVSLIITSNSRIALSKLASNYYASPSKAFRLIAVTGTNGKTTTTHLIKAILEKEKKVGIMGTLYAKIDDKEYANNHTTPEALEIEEFFAKLKSEKADYAVMEVSSHALELNRVDSLDFDVAIFTNISQDHLDFHENMENYKKAKLKLFQMISDESNKFCIVNADDPLAVEIISNTKAKVFTYGINNKADLMAEDVKISLKGSSFIVKYNDKPISFDIKLAGLFSVYNTLAAICFAIHEGIKPSVIVAALEEQEGVSGRFEKVDCGQNFTVIVDYAHTPDGLENILKTAKEIAVKRLITVFGCGGDRDRSKRPIMGEMAAKYSDFSIVTSDNPRSEKAEDIIHDIIPGLEKVAGSRFSIIVDRTEAIKHALYLAREGDLIIIAGKGHETYQIIKDKIFDFDDREVVKNILRSKE